MIGLFIINNNNLQKYPWLSRNVDPPRTMQINGIRSCNSTIYAQAKLSVRELKKKKNNIKFARTSNGSSKPGQKIGFKHGKHEEEILPNNECHSSSRSENDFERNEKAGHIF